MYGSYNHQLSLSLSCSVSFALCLTFYNFHFSNPAEWKFPGTTSCANIFQLSRSLPLSVSFLFLFLTPFQYAFSINLTPYPIVGICIRSDLNLSLFLEENGVPCHTSKPDFSISEGTDGSKFDLYLLVLYTFSVWEFSVSPRSCTAHKRRKVLKNLIIDPSLSV